MLYNNDINLLFEVTHVSFTKYLQLHIYIYRKLTKSSEDYTYYFRLEEIASLLERNYTDLYYSNYPVYNVKCCDITPNCIKPYGEITKRTVIDYKTLKEILNKVKAPNKKAIAERILFEVRKIIFTGLKEENEKLRARIEELNKTNFHIMENNKVLKEKLEQAKQLLSL